MKKIKENAIKNIDNLIDYELITKNSLISFSSEKKSVYGSKFLLNVDFLQLKLLLLESEEYDPKPWFNLDDSWFYIIGKKIDNEKVIINKIVSQYDRSIIGSNDCFTWDYKIYDYPLFYQVENEGLFVLKITLAEMFHYFKEEPWFWFDSFKNEYNFNVEIKITSNKSFQILSINNANHNDYNASKIKIEKNLFGIVKKIDK